MFPEDILKETCDFSGCLMFLKKWTNETIASKILLPHIILTHPIEIYSHINARKKFGPTKFCQSFKLSPSIMMGEGRNHEQPKGKVLL